MSDRPKYVRLRGLPFSSKENDIRTFLDGCCLTIVSLPLNPEGRPSGEGFVGLKTEEDVQNALAKNKELIQKRYIEVFRISHEELANALRRGFISEEGRLIKLRGLPFSASDKDIKEFLSDVEVEEVVFGRNAEGRPSGEAFVRLASKDDVKAALLKNKQHMGKRYVEVYDSKPEEINRARGLGPQRNGPPALRDIGHPLPLMHGPPMPGFEMDARSPRGGMGGPPCGPPMWDDGRGGGMPPMMEMERTFPQRPSRIVDYDEMYEGRGGPIRAVPPSMGMYSRASPYDGGGGGGVEDWNSPTKILMKGLPFDVNPHAIERFFAPLRCFDIKIGFNEERRPSGDGSVEFGTISETREALQRHKQTIGQRYIELYSSSEVPPSIRRIRFKRVGGAMSVPPAPLTTPSHRSMPAAPIPTGRPPIPPPRFEQPMMGGGGPPHRGPPRGYEDQMGGGYGMPSPAVRGPPSRGVPPPPPSGRNDGAYSSFPSREYNGVPQERENYGGYGRAAQESYAPPSVNTHAPPSYGMYDVKPEVKREVYDGYGRGGGDGYGSGGGYGGYGDEGMAPPQRTADPYGGTPRRPAPAHNGGGDYTGYEGYGSGGGGGQYGGRNAGGGDRYF
ncbi:hypothetical protein PENTCL1PPCAC_18208 [Pristionchus entomophagus]|uniref:RRM domain-containing protein n=1 Tax=Pristionchus entomophagus TaxID=358040 RepID=A0AAV5TP85_9BILA|nr:hypothetical protein PENTCL1PPCAC_18208 [Pristionchus entomophagus]